MGWASVQESDGSGEFALLSQKIRCIVYETTKSTPSKTCNSLLFLVSVYVPFFFLFYVCKTCVASWFKDLSIKNTMVVLVYLVLAFKHNKVCLCSVCIYMCVCVCVTVMN